MTSIRPDGLGSLTLTNTPMTLGPLTLKKPEIITETLTQAPE